MKKSYVPINPDPIDPIEAGQTHPLVLANLGDAIHTLYVRASLIDGYAGKVNGLHREACARVNAAAQANLMKSALPLLNEEEADVFRRARNSHVNTVAKNASVADYKYATALEALIGYLYLTGRTDRLELLLQADTNSVSPGTTQTTTIEE